MCLLEFAFHFTFGEVKGIMRKSPRNLKTAFDHKGLTHLVGVLLFHEIGRLLQLGVIHRFY